MNLERLCRSYCFILNPNLPNKKYVFLPQSSYPDQLRPEFKNK